MGLEPMPVLHQHCPRVTKGQHKALTELSPSVSAVMMLKLACPCLNLGAMLAWHSSLHALPNSKQHAPTPHAERATHAQTL